MFHLFAQLPVFVLAHFLLAPLRNTSQTVHLLLLDASGRIKAPRLQSGKHHYTRKEICLVIRRAEAQKSEVQKERR